MTSLTLSVNLRLKAAGIHLLSSAFVAAIASVLVFRVWYPFPFSEIAGGTHLFLLLVIVDVVIGPALTAVVASASKPRTELVRDLAVVVALQLSAFAYGMYTVAAARPIALVFEIDLLRAVSAADIESSALGKAPEDLRQLPWTGPRLLAAVKPTDAAELMRTIDLELSGVPLAAMPDKWRPFKAVSEAAWRAARPVPLLQAKYPSSAAEVSRLAAAAGEPVTSLRFLPLLSRRASWVALVAPPDARVVGYLPLEGYF